MQLTSKLSFRGDRGRSCWHWKQESHNFAGCGLRKKMPSFYFWFGSVERVRSNWWGCAESAFKSSEKNGSEDFFSVPFWFLFLFFSSLELLHEKRQLVDLVQAEADAGVSPAVIAQLPALETTDWKSHWWIFWTQAFNQSSRRWRLERVSTHLNVFYVTLPPFKPS